MNGESSGTKLKVYSSVLPSQLMINWACHIEQYMLSFKHGLLRLLLTPSSMQASVADTYLHWSPCQLSGVVMLCSICVLWMKNTKTWCFKYGHKYIMDQNTFPNNCLSANTNFILLYTTNVQYTVLCIFQAHNYSKDNEFRELKRRQDAAWHKARPGPPFSSLEWVWMLASAYQGCFCGLLIHIKVYLESLPK